MPKIFKDLDLSGKVLRNKDYSNSHFINVDLSNTDWTGSDFSNSLFENSSFENSILKNVNFRGADFRGGNINNTDIRGANFYFSILENCPKENVLFDSTTNYFEMVCPEKGYFIGYKKCFNDRIVKLLILKDSLRSSSTNDACRTNKAKVLSITDIENKRGFNEATSFVDENFVYRVGEVVHSEGFNEDRWVDSTTGIHFYMTRELALGYM